MAYADPQSTTIGASTISLPRTGSGPTSGVFTSADGTTKLTISNAYTRRTRRVYRLDISKISADPLLPSQNVRTNYATYLVLDTPLNGVSSTEAIDAVKAICGMLSASSYAAVTKFVGGES